ncbi:hypothetical protein LTR91_021031 [Friedmanniomyces endolithicus]|uniref:F-box domain-containing protein n=1 Tax=Friedmanniomyces endolithicus TaxID=329885 RepID=A0AAN6H6P6_9PEZI|nr:hypothetical protein LTR94_015390 [Friedmanniomyces endolithicus]KAK0775472.1 hypothetical protein LTR38_015844 [Friedmanniomyces endolithicus]KAK0777348.1 hypothetical protein LTR59_013890 [Friedmanniomyces endolithicus]KAK0830160.1 hypothetical protein LTR03_015945 [Friedmanniomyces endolithicus]KAK0870666.1 hypothetical protein LTR87_013212 [Friedmanniomyces endolithicus]
MDDLLARFHVLDPEQREDTSSHLVAAHTGTERGTLSQMISARSDPLNRLPIELVQEIFHHLPVLNAWHLQHVCRHWRAILSSPRFLATTLARHGRLPVATATSPRNPDGDTIRQAIRQMQAERLGRPFSYYETRVDSKERLGKRSSCAPGMFALCGHSIAYVRTTIAGGSCEVVAHDLVTGQDGVFCGEAGEDITRITLTGNLLGFTSKCGVLYVADLRVQEPPLRVRMPSAQATALTSDEDTIAVLAGPSTIAVYSSNTNMLETYSFTRQVEPLLRNPLQPTNILLSVRHGTIDVFSNGVTIEGPGDDRYAKPSGSPMIHYVGHMRFDLCRCHHSEHEPLKHKASSTLELYVTNELERAVISIEALGIGEQYHLRTRFGGVLSACTDWRLDQSVIFDAKTAVLRSLHDSREKITRNDRDGNEIEARHELTTPPWIRWKDCYYGVGCEWVHTSSCSFVSTFTELPEGRDPPEDKAELAYQSCIPVATCSRGEYGSAGVSAMFMNGPFLAVFFTMRFGVDRLIVYCFDERVQMAGGRTTGLWGPKAKPETAAALPSETPEQRSVFQYTTARGHVALPFEDGRRAGDYERWVVRPNLGRDQAA